MLDFRIHTFLAVCSSMNYTKAAEILNITQPAVSQHIRYLEEYYDCKLFSYHEKKLSLTPAGSALLRVANTMHHDINCLKSELNNLNTQQENISFGATLTVGEFILPQIIGQYIEKNPKVQISMHVDNTDELLSLLRKGELDFAIIEGYYPKDEFDTLSFSLEPFIAICGKNYQYQNPEVFLSKKKKIELNTLLKERLITREPGSGSREILERFLSGHNLHVDDFPAKTVVNNIHVIKELVMANCGIAFLYRAAVKKELLDGTLLELPLKSLNISHEITFLWNKNSIYREQYLKYYYFFKKYLS